MPEFVRDHIRLGERTVVHPYTSNSSGRSKVIVRGGVNRIEQGEQIRSEFTAAVNVFTENAPLEDFVYIVFRSTPGFLLDIDKFDDQARNIRLASYKVIYEDEETQVYEATVFLNRNAISKFLRKVEDYLTRDTITGRPKNQSLIANISTIRAATLQSFWQEPELLFPAQGELVWWELWISRDPAKSIEEQLNPILGLLENSDILVNRTRYLSFPEHIVFLARATADQLSVTILYTDLLSELRKPRETADYFAYLDRQEQAEWMSDLNGRVDLHQDTSQISVCLLDTGVNITNPLLTGLIPAANLDAVEPTWTRADSHPHGHGTPMAGLSFYGDLSDALHSNERVHIYHHLESIKIIEQGQPNRPELYGAVTQEAVARGEILNPNHKRLVCMAVTTDSIVHQGRPSSWSAAVDQLLFGQPDTPNTNTIAFISSGNLPIEHRLYSPLINDSHSIEDPAQAFNAITVGAYTLKDTIDANQFPNATLVSDRGGMSPCNTTSVEWISEWPRKPDIVMEGGNCGIFNTGLIDPDSLQLLSTGKGGLARPWLTIFGDTSASTALASKFAAELYYYYPELWPETIRGLIIHSARWTRTMLGNRRIVDLSPDEKKKLLCTVGYGVPNLQQARFSASNSLSLLIERIIKPYKLEDGRIQTDEFHLIDLPWPVEALQQMSDTTVQLKVTLSYFIEPNPGNKQYELAASYRSHGLRFKMLGSQEGDAAFLARISKDMRDEEYIAEGKENWVLGAQIRDKGSVHKDIWEGSAADLATRNKIAVYPVGGWWKMRKYLTRYDYSIRYSLIVTINSPDNGIDIYTPVQIQVPIEV